MLRNRIHFLRKSKGWSQEDLAKKVHVTQTAVSQWEKGKSNPDTQTAGELATIFNVSLDYLYGRSDDAGASYYTSSESGDILQNNRNVDIRKCGGGMSEEKMYILRVFDAADVPTRTRILGFVVEIENEMKARKDETARPPIEGR